VGNFDHVLEKGFEQSYWPFIDVMLKHPKIKWALHTSGILWDYFVKKHPEYLEAVNKMVAEGRVEMMTGGYFEPILPSIPDKDKKGQILMMTDFIKKNFGYDASGLWLTERVWEPHMAKVLSEAGIKYIVVDDAHFAATGMDVDKLSGYYVTEEQGVTLNIFPISQKMRYSMPFDTVEKNMEYFAHLHKTMENPAVVMADDGEKFGMWPETYKHVYQDGWLEKFLTAVENASDWIETITFSQYMAKFGPKGRVYLPTASYFEMSEWSLPSESQEVFENVVKQFDSQERVKRFLRGGFWRNFLTKYSEANNMHKKMLYVSEKINRNSKKLKTSLEPAISALYQGECNCAYWHGVFGGLYLPHLRTAVYQKLIEAESFLAKDIVSPKWKTFDFDKDGSDEAVYESREQNIYVAPSKGGSIFEWDFLPKKLNMMNVLTRRKEAYHSRLREFLAKNPGASNSDAGAKTIHDLVKVKEANLDKYLNYDWYNRVSLLDHFFHPGTSFDDFKFARYGEQGDFVLGAYKAKSSGQCIVLKRKGTVWINDVPRQIELTKSLTPVSGGMEINYSIKNSDGDFDMIFAGEFCFSFSNQNDNENSILKDVASWERKDDGFGIALSMGFSQPVELWTFPLETVSLSEAGFERTYQGTVVLPIFRAAMKAGKSRDFKITLKVI
jgi:alpha-amylase